MDAEIRNYLYANRVEIIGQMVFKV
jgi:hypothetical protein